MPHFKKFRNGAIALDAWVNVTQTNEGIIQFLNFSIKRGYTIDNGQTWKHSTTFGKRDLVKIKALIDECITDPTIFNFTENQANQTNQGNPDNPENPENPINPANPITPVTPEITGNHQNQETTQG